MIPTAARPLLLISGPPKGDLRLLQLLPEGAAVGPTTNLAILAEGADVDQVLGKVRDNYREGGVCRYISGRESQYEDDMHILARLLECHPHVQWDAPAPHRQAMMKNRNLTAAWYHVALHFGFTHDREGGTRPYQGGDLSLPNAIDDYGIWPCQLVPGDLFYLHVEDPPLMVLFLGYAPGEVAACHFAWTRGPNEWDNEWEQHLGTSEAWSMGTTVHLERAVGWGEERPVYTERMAEALIPAWHKQKDEVRFFYAGETYRECTTWAAAWSITPEVHFVDTAWPHRPDQCVWSVVDLDTLATYLRRI